MSDKAKETNPKDAVGVRKVPFSTLSAQVTAEVGLAMLEGARKYGRHNYRVAGVRMSVYYDATMRHLTAWWDGQDLDPDSGLSHITKAIAALYVLRDAMMNDMAEDDRPPEVKDPNWQARMNVSAGQIIDRYPDAKAPFVRQHAELPSGWPSAGVVARAMQAASHLSEERWEQPCAKDAYCNCPLCR
jgi:hypothetical protein